MQTNPAVEQNKDIKWSKNIKWSKGTKGCRGTDGPTIRHLKTDRQTDTVYSVMR